jgi:hypothetical protein
LLSVDIRFPEQSGYPVVGMPVHSGVVGRMSIFQKPLTMILAFVVIVALVILLQIAFR